MPIHSKPGELITIAEDSEGPIMQVVRVNGVPWLYFWCTSTDIKNVGKGMNFVVNCKNSRGDWVQTTIQPGLCGDEAGNEQGDIDIGILVDGKLRIAGWAGIQGPDTGPGLILDGPNFWNIGSPGAPLKKVY
jgi:hypothetical protein